MSKSISFLVLTLACTALPAFARAAEVRLRSSATCATAIVRLADVAEILDDDARLAQALGGIPLFPSPAAGASRVLLRQELLPLIALSGVEKAAIQITGSEAVTVSAGGTVTNGSIVKRPMAVAGVRQAAFETEPKGPKPGEAGPKPAAKADESASKIEREVVVERGAGVTVHANTAGIRVTTSGKALEAGAVDETIGIELADSKQRVLARVVGPQLVEVAVGRGSPPADVATRAAANTAIHR